MTPIMAMANNIEREYADIYGEPISTANAIRLATAALEGLIDDLGKSVRVSVLIRKAMSSVPKEH